MKNSKGTVYYGMHFYPGVAEYQEPGAEPYRVFLNEDTIRAMDPSFAGRPVFVMHVDGVDDDMDVLRKDADGWVIESFFNQADGKHWVKFLVVSDRAETAIRNGMRLSNCYVPKNFANGGLWNGVSYLKEITGGEYEHLAIVPNPRYEESVILSPEEFKKYNEDKIVELKRLANSNKERVPMLKFFKRAKVENTIDLESMSVVLPKSGKELTITELVNEMDAHEEKKKEPQMANGEDHVTVGDTKMMVNELVEKYNALCAELDALKNPKKDMGDESDATDPAVVGNKEDEDAKKKALELAEHEEKEIVEAKQKNDIAEAQKKADAKKKADALRNAHLTADDEVAVVELSEDRVARGKSRYGSK